MPGPKLAPMTRPKPAPAVEPRPERPRMWKVILLNDDYTPREFVTIILMSVFRLSQARADAVMLTAHQKGACVVMVTTREVAETRSSEAMERAKEFGFPLAFSTEPEE